MYEWLKDKPSYFVWRVAIGACVAIWLIGAAVVYLV